MVDYQEIREKVIYFSLQSQKTGLIKGTSGNISLRSDDGKVIAITPTSIPYELLKPEDIPLVDENGKVLDGKTKPSSELPMHTHVLRARKDINAVVHTHAMFCTVMSVLNISLPAMTVPQLGMGLFPVNVIPFEMPGSEDLGNAIVNGLGDGGKGVLMANHGMLVVDTSLEKAFAGAEYLEEAAQIAYYSLLGGGINPIPEKIINIMVEIAKSRAL